MPITGDRPEASTTIRTDLGAIFVLFGIEPIDLADHIFVAGRPGKDVEAFGSRQRCRRALGTI